MLAVDHVLSGRFTQHRAMPNEDLRDQQMLHCAGLVDDSDEFIDFDPSEPNEGLTIISEEEFFERYFD